MSQPRIKTTARHEIRKVKQRINLAGVYVSLVVDRADGNKILGVFLNRGAVERFYEGKDASNFEVIDEPVRR